MQTVPGEPLLVAGGAQLLCSCPWPWEMEPQGCSLPPRPRRARNCWVNTQQLPCESGAASSELVQAGAAQLWGQGVTQQSQAEAMGSVVGCNFGSLG